MTINREYASLLSSIVLSIIMLILIVLSLFTTGSFGWTRYGVVLSGNHRWENDTVAEPCLLYENSTFRLWYRGATGTGGARIGYATSSDCIHWARYFGNPILEVLGGVAYPYVIKIENVYYLYAVKLSTNFLYRWTSRDGIDWTIDNNGDAVLKSSGNEWDSILCNCAVLYDSESQYHWLMLYEAKGVGNIFQIGYAYSNDGLNWTKYPNNPIFPIQGYELTESGAPFLKKVGNRYYCWMCASSNNDDKDGIWCAYSTDMMNWVYTSDNPQLAGSIQNKTSDPSIVEVSNAEHKVYCLYTEDQHTLTLAYMDKTPW
jgi:predicted GH43/DUF377 family glycosyl hydrolase